MPNHFKQEITLSLSIIGGSIIVFGVLLYFLSQDVVSQADKIVADRLVVSQRATAIEALAELKNNKPKANAYFEAMNKILVTQDQLLDFPRWLDGLARVRQVGMNFSFHGTQNPSTGSSPGFISFSLDLTGASQNLIDFMKDIEFRSPRFLATIDNFDFTRKESGYRIMANGKVFFK